MYIPIKYKNEGTMKYSRNRKRQYAWTKVIFIPVKIIYRRFPSPLKVAQEWQRWNILLIRTSTTSARNSNRQWFRRSCEWWTGDNTLSSREFQTDILYEALVRKFSSQTHSTNIAGLKVVPKKTNVFIHDKKN